jgi:hypothetical protein
MVRQLSLLLPLLLIMMMTMMMMMMMGCDDEWGCADIPRSTRSLYSQS